MMKTNDERKIKKEIRAWTICFMSLLVLSGITAFPLVTELNFMNLHSGIFPGFLREWIHQVYISLSDTNEKYPFLSYGTDWLAFAHLVIAVAFIGPLKDPVRNIWVIQFGIISCLMVLPLALIAGHFRGIPFFHQLIDCSFGIIGLIPLTIVSKKILLLEKITNLKK